jgi:hypothetical protein
MASILVLAVPVAAGDLYTPLVASAFQQRTIPMLGTDGQLHVVYELTAVNTRTGTAALERRRGGRRCRARPAAVNPSAEWENALRQASRKRAFVAPTYSEQKH